MTHFLFIAVFSIFTFTGAEQCQEETQFSAGATELTAISLKNTKGETVSLVDIKKHKASVFVLLSPECPLSQNYTLILHNLERKFRSKNIKFYIIIPGSDFSFEEITDFEKQYNVTATVLLDNKYLLTKALAATVTPEAIIADQEGKKIYQGKIDNWAFALGKKRQVITEYYVEDALYAHLENQPITTKQTTPVGCFIFAKGHE